MFCTKKDVIYSINIAATGFHLWFGRYGLSLGGRKASKNYPGDFPNFAGMAVVLPGYRVFCTHQKLLSDAARFRAGTKKIMTAQERQEFLRNSEYGRLLGVADLGKEKEVIARASSNPDEIYPDAVLELSERDME